MYRSSTTTNYMHMMYPYLCIARVMGFLPYKIKSSKLVYFKPYAILSAILLVSYIVLAVLSLFNIHLRYINVYKYKPVLKRLHPTCVATLGPVLFISAFASSQSVLRTIKKMSEISRMLPPKIYLSMAKRIYIKDILMLIPLLSYFPFVILDYRKVMSSFVWFTFIGVLVIVALYTSNVYVVEACFKEINGALVKVKDTLINDQPHLLRRVYHTRKKPMFLTELRMLKRQHLEISEIVKMLNSAFGMSNLLIFTLLFIDISLNLYKYLVERNQGGKLTEWFSYVLIFVLYYVTHIILIIWFVEKAKTQVQQIGSNIHRIIIRTYDKEITDELKLFSLQVLQRDITFTATGLVIDATLLTKAVYTITTFLVILVQFLVKPC